MTSYDPITKKEARHHSLLLIGMAAILAVVAIGDFFWLGQVMQGP